MKIRPVILCGGAGTRLWPNAKKHQAKQFIDFGNWTLLGKTLERVKAPIFDAPIISTNAKYLKQVKQHLKKHKIGKFKIVLEPAKRNTAPAILSTALIKDIPREQPLINVRNRNSRLATLPDLTKRVAGKKHRELAAQGVGNAICGVLGAVCGARSSLSHVS